MSEPKPIVHITPDGQIPSEFTTRHFQGPDSAGTQILHLDYRTAISLSSLRYQESEKAEAAKNWDFKTGLSSARAMATRGGWPKGWELITERLTRLRGRIKGKRLRPEYRSQVVPYRVPQINMTAFLAGDPRVYRNRKPSGTPQTATNGNLVTIYVDLATSCGVDATRFCARGTAILLAVEGLRLAGKTPQVIIGIGIDTHDGHRWGVRVALPPTLTGPELAFWLAHPAGFRRIGFTWIEHLPISAGPGYGRPVELPYASCKADLAVTSSACLTKNGRAAVEWASDAAVEQWVLSILADQGVEA